MNKENASPFLKILIQDKNMKVKRFAKNKGLVFRINHWKIKFKK